MRRILTGVVVALLCAMPAAGQQYDVVIRGGTVLDGTGNPWYRADVAISGDRIAAVGDLSGARAAREIDASGLYVSPGFIDVHTHDAEGLATAELSEGRPLLAQGLTTVFVNPDGGGPGDMAEQRRALLRDGLGVNVAQFIPHNTIRREVVGMRDRAPTAAEMERMRALVREGMEAGAFGLSTGLFSAPGSWAPLGEVIELARVAGEYGGAYASHIRDESDYTIGLVAAVDEVIRVAREADMTGVVTHIKALGPRVWGLSDALVKRIERARAQGVDIFADQYPYTASATSLGAALLPRWAEAGGRDSLLIRMDDPALRDRLRRDMLENLDRRGGAARIQFRRYEADESVEGRTLREMADEWGVDAITAAQQLIRGGDPGIVSFNQSDADVELLMRQPWVMTCSDGTLVPMGEGVPHPRSYGAFPRKLRTYAVEKGVIDLAFAVRSMTALPAAVFGVRDRGVVREGAVADLVVFDLDAVRAPSDYTDPHRLSEGMVHVFVNGQSAIAEGSFTGVESGRVLSLNGSTRTTQ